VTAIPDRRRLLTVLLPVSAIAVSLGSALLALAVTPADLLGYDYAAYLEAARRLVEGQPLYDLSVTETGGFGFFYYPPPYAALMIPFLVLPASIGPWVWAAVLYAAFVGGVLAMPVRPTVRWLTLLLFGISWPLVYSLKLGQVGPLLVLTFALGWRWLDRPLHLGATGCICRMLTQKRFVDFTTRASGSPSGSGHNSANSTVFAANCPGQVHPLSGPAPRRGCGQDCGTRRFAVPPNS